MSVGAVWSVGTTRSRIRFRDAASPTSVAIFDGTASVTTRRPEPSLPPHTFHTVASVTLGQLCKHALRMSPKRLICGELRSGDEAIHVCHAMTTGNDGSMSTIHSRSAENSLEKLGLLLAMSAGLDAPVAANLISQAVDLVVYLHMDRHTGKRLVMEVREVTGHEGSKVLTNAIFTRGRDGQLRPTGVLSDRLRERLIDVGFDPRKLTVGAA